MNVFILNAGRSGSTTFNKACQHITNYTSAHESRAHVLGSTRLDYPQNHIEADNRLSWFLGRLDKQYGNDALYVHLTRNVEATAKSHAQRAFRHGIFLAYRKGILTNTPIEISDMSVALDYCDTVNSNIELFLKDKTNVMTFQLENAAHDFQLFWELIGAEGDREAALAEFERKHNATIDPTLREPKKVNYAQKVVNKILRIVRKIPRFIREA